MDALQFLTTMLDLDRRRDLCWGRAQSVYGVPAPLDHIYCEASPSLPFLEMDRPSASSAPADGVLMLRDFNAFQ